MFMCSCEFVFYEFGVCVFYPLSLFWTEKRERWFIKLVVMLFSLSLRGKPSTLKIFTYIVMKYSRRSK